LIFDTRIRILLSEGSDVSQKPTRSAAPAKNEQSDFGRFTRLLDKILSVPHSKIKAELNAESKRTRPKKRAPSGHAFSDTD